MEKTLKPKIRIFLAEGLALLLFVGIFLGFFLLIDLIPNDGPEDTEGKKAFLVVCLFLVILPCSFMLFALIMDLIKPWKIRDSGVKIKKIFFGEIQVSWSQISGVAYRNSKITIYLDPKGKEKSLSYINYEDYKQFSQCWALGKFVNDRGQEPIS